MLFNPTATQTRAINVECNPHTGTQHSTNAPPAAAVDSSRNATAMNPKAMRVCVEGIPARGLSPKRKLECGSRGKHISVSIETGAMPRLKQDARPCFHRRDGNSTELRGITTFNVILVRQFHAVPAGNRHYRQ